MTRNASDGAYTVFVDGVLERSGTLASGVIGAGYSSFGRIEDSAGTPIYFSGDLDEVYIFDGVIDSAKVNELLNDSRSCLQCVNDDFNGATLGSDWAVSSSGGTFGNPRIVNGRLRLTDSSNSVATAASLLRLFPGAGNEIIYEFDHYAYSGSGADGIAITLSDASITPIPGGYGGSLGYAQRCGIDGFAGGGWGLGSMNTAISGMMGSAVEMGVTNRSSFGFCFYSRFWLCTGWIFAARGKWIFKPTD